MGREEEGFKPPSHPESEQEKAAFILPEPARSEILRGFPMQIFIDKNESQLGPFPKSKVAEMLV